MTIPEQLVDVVCLQLQCEPAASTRLSAQVLLKLWQLFEGHDATPSEGPVVNGMQAMPWVRVKTEVY